MINNHETIDVFIGVDVGKSNHHAVALNRAGKKLLDKALPQDEAKLKSLIKSLSKHGKLLFVVDQPATIGALPVAVAQAQGSGHRGNCTLRNSRILKGFLGEVF